MTILTTITIALVGNPNSGKSTLFNALSGLRQHVGNYSGVTVEMKKGSFTHDKHHVELIDLPGTYSLAARSPDERVAVDLLLGRVPGEKRLDAILAIVDASNLDRHLYLTTQLMELGLPVVLAVNMVDLAAGQGIVIDLAKLSQHSGLKVVAIQANRGVGLDELRKALVEAAATPASPTALTLPKPINLETGIIHETLKNTVPMFLARRVLLDIDGDLEKALVVQHEGFAKKLAASRLRLSEAGCPIPATEAKARYAWIRNVISQSVTKPSVRPSSTTDRLDRVLTHKLWGTLIFLVVMFTVFMSIYIAAAPIMDVIKDLFGELGDFVKAKMDPGPLRGLIVDGIIGGVGSVIVFLPQIMILFGFIAILEDCGYMARAAFLMDKLMSRCGLSGKSFIPMLSSVACAIPGIMATRTIEHRRDRLATIMVAPLMSCSARLPVYTLLIGTFLGTSAGYPVWVSGVTLFGLYMIGFVTAPLVALLLKRTLLKGATPAYVMVLPVYQRPRLKAILRRMIESGGSFLKRAGTLIFASMVLVWAVMYFPNHKPDDSRYDLAVDAAEEAKDDEAAKQLQGEWQRQSYLGRTGHALEPVFTPLGWDWKIGMATLASFPAREVIVGTLGIVYNMGNVKEEDRQQLGSTIKDEWKDDAIRGKYGVPVAISVMVFFALCCQCVSTLAVIRRETKSWWWPAFTFTYMTTLAYMAAFVTFRIGRVIVDAV
ncbi:ferrous iron transport protein B [soil metagenome]